jgi:hypothetical protein
MSNIYQKVFYGKDLRRVGPPVAIVLGLVAIVIFFSTTNQEDASQTMIPIDTTPVNDMFKVSPTDSPAVQSAGRNANIAYNRALSAINQLGNEADTAILNCIRALASDHTRSNAIAVLQMPISSPSQIRDNTLSEAVLEHEVCKGFTRAALLASYRLALNGESPVLNIALPENRAGAVSPGNGQQIQIALKALENEIAALAEAHALWLQQQEQDKTSTTSPF